jgi:hypothetical protein
MSAHLDLLQKQKKTSKKKVSSAGGVVEGKQLDGKKKEKQERSLPLSKHNASSLLSLP